MIEPMVLRYWWRREMRPKVLFRRFLAFLGCAASLQCILNLIEGPPYGLISFAHSAYYTPWLVAPVAAWFALQRLGVSLATDAISVTPATDRELCLWIFLPFCCSLVVAYEGSVIVYWAVQSSRSLAAAHQLGTQPYYFAVHHNLQAALSIFLLPFVLFALILVTKSFLPRVAVMIGFELIMLACALDAYSQTRGMVDFFVMNRLLLIAGLCSVGWVIPRFRQLLTAEVVPDQVAPRTRIVWLSCGLLFALLSVKVLHSMSLENARICRETLWKIDSAKELYASKIQVSKSAAVTMTNLGASSILSSGKQAPRCHSGGIYEINAVGIDPTCSIPGHILIRVNETDMTALQSAYESARESADELVEMAVGPGLHVHRFEQPAEPKLRRIWRLLWKLEW